MADGSKIEWTDATINPIRARSPGGKLGWHCVKISPACTNCYAAALNQGRFGNGLPYTANSGAVPFLDEAVLRKVLTWKKPRRIFWCSMTDLFLESHPDEWIDKCFAAMALTPQHTHQILTKRSDRMVDYIQTRGYRAYNDVRVETERWPARNIWPGFSAENQECFDRRVFHLGPLMRTGWTVFVSAEPLLGPILMEHDQLIDGVVRHWLGKDGIAQVIVGGESGPKARPIHPAWARSIRDQCQAVGVPFFFKQWGEWMPISATQHAREYGHACKTEDWSEVHRQRLLNFPNDERGDADLPIDATPYMGREYVKRMGKKAAGRLLDGKEWSEFPDTKARTV